MTRPVSSSHITISAYLYEKVSNMGSSIVNTVSRALLRVAETFTNGLGRSSAIDLSDRDPGNECRPRVPDCDLGNECRPRVNGEIRDFSLDAGDEWRELDSEELDSEELDSEVRQTLSHKPVLEEIEKSKDEGTKIEQTEINKIEMAAETQKIQEEARKKLEDCLENEMRNKALIDSVIDEISAQRQLCEKAEANVLAEYFPTETEETLTRFSRFSKENREKDRRACLQADLRLRQSMVNQRLKDMGILSQT